jgi:membrane fusion protein (multidrug efflux system)
MTTVEVDEHTGTVPPEGEAKAAGHKTSVVSTEKSATPKSRLWPRLLGAGILAAVLVGGTLYWLDAQHYESTDDAQVDGHFAAISTRINGTVAKLNPKVENNRFVEAGTLLMELDPRDFEVELEHAQANLRIKQAEARGAQLQVPITDATASNLLNQAEAARQGAVDGVATAEADLTTAQHRVKQDEALADRAERDRVRYQSLVEKREISRSAYDARATESAAAVQTLEADRSAAVAAEQRIAQMRSMVRQREAQVASAGTAPQQSQDVRSKVASAQAEVDQALADVHTAELNLSYTKVYAPVSGVIGRKTVELGHRVQPGQSLLTIVPVDDIWITANFKETQLKQMRPGQQVTLHVDTFERDYKGTVEELAGAAGPLFSLFPPENATGNYVKVVQRFPIRIRVEQGQDTERQLRPGMSVEATVRVR